MENLPQQQEMTGVVTATIEAQVYRKETYKCPKCQRYISIRKEDIPKGGMICPVDASDMMLIKFKTVKMASIGGSSMRDALRPGRSRNNWKGLKRAFRGHRISLDQPYSPARLDEALGKVRGQYWA